jgi:4a-hydroxytetrahydrobiopterin dehydratase
MRNISSFQFFESRNSNLPVGWSESNNLIYKEFKFKDFLTAMGFLNGCGEIANRLDHHPRMTIDYDKVLIETYTHETGGVTHKDLELADRINLLYPN